MKAIIKDHSADIVDARSADRFAGRAPEPRPGVRPGHIPGSLNVPYGKLLDTDGTLKSKAELEKLFARAGVDLEQADRHQLRLGHHRQRLGAGARRDRTSPHRRL